MKQEIIEVDELSYAPCRYGSSRMLFRGPRRNFDSPYLAFIGGTETYGKFIEKPFPALVEKSIQQTCVNLGCVNGGIDAYVNDAKVIEICKCADMTVLQIMGANHLSNRFYSVHPRRNDRFLGASSVLNVIYDDVDFSEFTFTRHMLGALYAKSPERFEIIVSELRQAWAARMKLLLERIGPRVSLLWFSDEELSNEHWSLHPSRLKADPLFITKDMVDDLRQFVREIVVVNPTNFALARATKGMVFRPSQASIAAEMLGVACHQEAAAALIPSLREHMLIR